MNEATAVHRARVAALAATVRAGAANRAAPLGLAKRTSNLFRDRVVSSKHRLDLGEFDHVLAIDIAGGWVDVEGLATYETLVDATLEQGVMPAVVPELKTITVGGAVAGVGIEATSFRQGLVHDTMLELDVLLPSGEVLTCTPDNECADLFHGFPNSYGTLGYALRVRLRTLPVKPFVRIAHPIFTQPGEFTTAIAADCEGDADFVDGVFFDSGLQVASVARFVDEAPYASDYGLRKIYYKSLPDRRLDFMHTRDYLWRWDTDWFWCSRNFGAEHPVVRRLLGRRRLNSRTWTAMMRWNARWGLAEKFAWLRKRYHESVIQDVDIPLAQANAFLEFLVREIGILPIWLCPARAPANTGRFPLYPLRPGVLYVNFGFWDVVGGTAAHEPGHFNRLVEREVARLGGIKSLYSKSMFTRDEFAAAYDMSTHAALKRKYDPGSRLLGLYEKCVLGA